MSNCLRIFIPLLLAVVVVSEAAAQRMRMVSPVFHGAYGMFEPEADPDSIFIEGRVVESLAKRELSDAFMIPVREDGTPGDTIKPNVRYSYSMGGGARNRSYFRFKVARRDSTYVFDVGCPRYTTQTVVYKVERVG